MITKTSLKELLSLLNFSEKGNVWEKEVNWFKFYVDFDKGKLGYPDGVTINDKTTSNLDKKENFVVFECVHRLVEKGYRPEHIELEPRWKLWHDAKSGKADIQIKDNKGKSLLLIECKTADWEFKSYWKKTLDDWDQLFSYFQQEKSTKFLCLYTSDIVDGKVKSEYYLINVQDNEELLKNLAKNKRKTYKEATTNKELFNVWKEIYQQDFSTRGLFEEDIASYDIWKYKYTINDLEEVDSEAIQKKYNEFAVILRQHNVSGRENAFDKLVNLFLAKVVDERNNPKELAFYWKWAAYDDYFHLQDRLQRLYKDWMEKFLNETVTYIDNDDIEKAFKLFKKDPDATKSAILDYLRELKFFTNNDFAFIDVHNEHLFYQNSEILKKIVQMLQDIKLKTETQNQFLGDLFEWFLDQWVKQNEGQFFTPMPIVKFLVSALPLKKIINQWEIPLVIDYACGAGHFLNEYATQIRKYVEEKGGDIKEYYGEITGIEKEYRLSKVSKVASFMYGQDEIKIIYADALAKKELEEEHKLKDGTYSVLIANPPYSVKWFLETLPEEDQEKYELTKEVSDKSKNNSIEAFFVERASQLLKDGWVAAIILPSSILSNGSIYIKTREILLQNFDIVAIAEFGSGTFGKTGTNTITLFLRKKASKPNLAEHYRNRVNSWFSGDFTKDKVFEDEEYIRAYCEKIQVSFDEYKKLFAWELSEELKKSEVFVEYQNEFKEKKLEKQKKSLVDFIIEKEKEKLYFFIFAKINPQPVLLVKSPTDNKAIKTYLWYERKAAKGNEGIHYLWTWAGSDDEEDFISKNKWINRIKTPLFDPNNLDSEEKINTLIRKNFLGENFEIPWELSGFVSKAYLVDMIEFNRSTFDVSIKTNISKKVEIESKYPLVRMWTLTEIQSGNTAPQWDELMEWGTYPFFRVSDVAKYHLTKNLIETQTYLNDKWIKWLRKFPKWTILIPKSWASTYLDHRAILWVDWYVVSHLATVNVTSDKILNEYLYEVLVNIKAKDLKPDSGYPSLNEADLSSIKVPLPSIDVQKKIVEECSKIDREYENSEETIENWRSKIEEIIGNTGWKKVKIKDICQLNPSKTEISNVSGDTVVSFVEMASVSNDWFIEKKEDRKLSDLKKWSYTYFAENDIIIAKITPCMENWKCAIAKWLTNEIGMWSSEFHVFRPSEKVLWEFLFWYLNREEIRKNAEKSMTWASWHRRVPISFYENLEIPVLPLEEQKKIVAKIEDIEKQIKDAKQVMDTCAKRKKEVLDKYLK